MYSIWYQHGNHTDRQEKQTKTAALRALLLAICCGWILAPGTVLLADETASASEDLDASAPESVEDLRRLQEQVRTVVQLARPATVAIEMDDSIGSGVIISPQGLVLTAGHVSVEPNQEVWVRFPDNTRVRGLSLGVNHPVDSGMVQILDEAPTEEGWPFVEVATGATTPGQWVVALGQPNGFIRGRAPPVRLGRVLQEDEETISTDATLVGGDSGGPLLNLRGEVVGIHSRIGRKITSNFHVPVSAFRDEWARLEEGRMTGAPDGEDPLDYRSLAGLSVRFDGAECVVTQVYEGRAADAAGILPGDVLLEYGDLVSPSAAALARYSSSQTL